MGDELIFAVCGNHFMVKQKAAQLAALCKDARDSLSLHSG